MIAVDASVILALLFEEEDAARFEERLLDAGGGVISPVNLWEILVRAQAAKGAAGRSAADLLLAGLGVVVAPISEAQARIAADAFARFGRGTKAALNLGDCFAYALAREEGDGLLFKGNDFPQTDIPSAL